MPRSTQLYGQLFGFLRQYCRVQDLRHLKALAWMVSALICSGQLSLSVWEPYVPSRATQAQSVERLWRRLLGNARVRVSRMYVPLVLAALSGWSQHRLYLALDTPVLWNRYCMIHLSVVRCLLWPCGAVVMARLGAWQCDCGVSGVSTVTPKSALVAASASRCHAVG